MVVGDIVLGDAAIYFDYNPAINTNQVATEFVDEVAGTDDPAMARVNVYPNPAGDVLYIQAGGEKCTIVVYNLLGQQVLQATDATAVNVSGLETGVYQVKVSTGNGTQQTFKVIKK